MASSSSLSITDALVEYLRESGLEKSVLEVQVEEAWPKVMGSVVVSLTQSVEMKDGVLYVRVRSAALKAQLL